MFIPLTFPTLLFATENRPLRDFRYRERLWVCQAEFFHCFLTLFLISPKSLISSTYPTHDICQIHMAKGLRRRKIVEMGTNKRDGVRHRFWKSDCRLTVYLLFQGVGSGISFKR